MGGTIAEEAEDRGDLQSTHCLCITTSQQPQEHLSAAQVPRGGHIRWPRPPKGEGEAARKNVVMSAAKRSCPDIICYLLSVIRGGTVENGEGQ